MKLTKKRLLKIVKYSVVIIIFTLVIFYAEHKELYRTQDNRLFDLFHIIKGLKRTPEHVALVEIDNETFTALKDVPMAFWGPHYAKAIGVLRGAGVKTIGVDAMFTISIESWFESFGADYGEKSRRYDLSFRKELASGGVSLIGTFAEKDGAAEIQLPIIEYVYSLPNTLNDIGLANLIYDKDSIIRRFTYAFFESDKPPYLSLAALLTSMQTGMEPPDNTAGGFQNIYYCGPSGTFPAISFSRLLHDDAHLDPEVQALKGKIIIIALSKDSKEDIQLTPYSKGSHLSKGTTMTGGEVHANIIETMINGNAPKSMAGAFKLLYLFLFSLISALIFFRLGSISGALSMLVLLIVNVFIAYMLFGANTFAPIFAVVSAVVLNYLLSLGLKFTSEEREKKYLRSVFEKYVSGEVVKQMVESGTSPALGGEMAEITVLFSDIRNFTTISEILKPFEVVEMLNRYFSIVCESILKKGGTIDKFLGDAVMVLFGSPLHYDDHAERALRTALIMNEDAMKFRGWMKERFAGTYDNLPEFNIGIGIHSGDAIVGNIGSTERFEFTAIGDTVNTASRLEGLSKEFETNIIVSKDVLGMVEREVITGKREAKKVKGKAEEVEVIEFLGFKE